MKTLKSILAIAGLVTSLSSHAGIIQTDALAGGSQINYYEPIGQSFTAEDSAIKFAFHYIAFNPSFPNDPLRISLLSGNGLTGATLATHDFSLADNFGGFFDIDFSAVNLTIGQSYTAALMIPGNSPYWGVASSNSDYAGGVGYSNFFVQGGRDWTFRVTPVGQSNDVPEPTTIALLGLGLLGFTASRRKSGKSKNA